MSSHHRLTAYFVFEKIPNPTNKMKRDHSEKVYRAKKKVFPPLTSKFYVHTQKPSRFSYQHRNEKPVCIRENRKDDSSFVRVSWENHSNGFLWVGNFLLLLPICLLNVRWRKIETFWCFYKFFPQFGRVQKGMKKCWAWKEIFKCNFCIKIEWIIKWMWKQV